MTLEVTNSKALPYLDSDFSLKAKPLHRVTKGRSGGGGNSSSKKLKQEKEPCLVKTRF